MRYLNSLNMDLESAHITGRVDAAVFEAFIEQAAHVVDEQDLSLEGEPAVHLPINQLKISGDLYRRQIEHALFRPDSTEKITWKRIKTHSQEVSDATSFEMDKLDFFRRAILTTTDGLRPNRSVQQSKLWFRAFGSVCFNAPVDEYIEQGTKLKRAIYVAGNPEEGLELRTFTPAEYNRYHNNAVPTLPKKTVFDSPK